MKWIRLTIVPFILLVLYCTEVTGPAGTPGPLPHQQQSPYYKMLANLVNIRVTGYDSLVIGSREGATLTGQMVKRIQLGRKVTGTFVADQDSAPQYSGITGNGIRFEFPVKLNEDWDAVYHFTLRFLLQDSTQVDVDSLALMYKFPYQSTEIFSKIFERTHKEVTGFQWLDSTLYFICPDGLYTFDISADHIEKLLSVASPKYLTGNSTHLFWVYYDRSVYKDMICKYDIQADSLVSVFDFIPDYDVVISGMAANSTKLYLLYWTQQYPPISILRIDDLEGNLIQPVQLDIDVSVMKFCQAVNNTLYIANYNTDRFAKLDLSSFASTEGNGMPSPSQAAFQFVNDRFYFLDNMRMFLGRLPADEVR